VFEITSVLVEPRHVRQTDREVDASVLCALEKRESAFACAFGVRIASLHAIHLGEVIEDDSELRIVGAELCFVLLFDLLEIDLSLRVIVQALIDDS
jgi:hypothetical protein